MDNWVDRFLVGVTGAGSERFDRRRILVVGSLAAAFTSLGFTIHRLTFEDGFNLAILNVVAATAILGITPLVMRLTGSYRVAAHLFLAGMSVTVFTDALLYGGVGAAAVYAMLAVPLIASFFLGRGPGLAYGGLQLAAIVSLPWLPELGLVRPADPALVPAMLTVGSFGMVSFITVFSAVYESERASTVAQAEAVIDQLADGVIAVDMEARIKTANPQAAHLLGVEVLPIGTSVAAVAEGELAALVIDAMRGNDRVERAFLLPSGRQAKVVASPIRLHGSHDGAVLIIRDVTLEHQVDRMKTDFISTVSHELRTPMTSVLGFAKVIRGQLQRRVVPALDPSDAKAAKAAQTIDGNLRIIVSEAERLTALIGDVLDIAKMESGRMEWHMESVDPEALARRAVEGCAGLFESGEVTLECKLQKELPPIHGDPHRLQQVLINLISNASKFTENGSVRLEVRTGGLGLRFEVIDTGVGMEADVLERIFDRFQQGVDTVSDKPRGTGLGLAIAREIALAHGGKLTVRSEVGKGSTFELQLPVAGADDRS